MADVDGQALLTGFGTRLADPGEDPVGEVHLWFGLCQGLANPHHRVAVRLGPLSQLGIDLELRLQALQIARG